MRIILYILKKEFIQIFRNRAMVKIIFFMPIVQLLVLSQAATYEMKDLKMHIVDRDMSAVSRRLCSKFSAGDYFKITGSSFNDKDAMEAINKNEADFYLTIPENFEKNLVKEGKASLNLSINAIDGAKGGIAGFYAVSIINDFNREEAGKFININTVNSGTGQINISYSNWYNTDLNYQTFMVPGLLVLLVSMISIFLSSMNIVREKEIGTIEQLNVTPIKKTELIIGKLIPFWLIGLFELGLGLIIAKLVFNIPFLGSPLVLFTFGGVFLVLALGVGLFISTVTDTQQQAMFISWFFMVVFILLSGLFSPVENMPVWVQNITIFNPMRYFIETIRMVMLKGSGFADLKLHFAAVAGFAVFINVLAVRNYKKRS